MPLAMASVAGHARRGDVLLYALLADARQAREELKLRYGQSLSFSPSTIDLYG
jgi:hypothetical protein